MGVSSRKKSQNLVISKKLEKSQNKVAVSEELAAKIIMFWAKLAKEMKWIKNKDCLLVIKTIFLDGWMEEKAVLRISYSNQKLKEITNTS